VAKDTSVRSVAIGPMQDKLCGLDLDELAGRRWTGDRMPLVLQAFQMKLDGFPDQCEHFPPRIAHGDAAGEVGHICAVRSRTFFDNDQITH
jgi:hypothetical protein